MDNNKEELSSNSQGNIEFIKDILQKYSMYIFLIVAIVVFQFLTNGSLLSPLNITNILLQNSYIFILTIGMLILVLLGDIDLSVGSVLGFTGALSGVLIIQNGMNPILGIVISLLAGLLIGMWQGFWVAYVNVPAFIATLAGLLTFRGLTIVILDGQTIANFPAIYQGISSGYIPDIGNGELHVTTLIVAGIIALLYVFYEWRTRLKAKKLGAEVESKVKFITRIVVVFALLAWFFYTLSSYAGLPNILILVAILAMLTKFITERTIIGRYIYAIGGNEQAATLSGINTKRIKFWSFSAMGLISGIAGIVFSARLNAAAANAGSGFELDAIAATYIGGASTKGGIGTVVGALVGALVMAVLNNGMSLMGVGADWQQAIKGIVLLFAVAVDVINKKKTNA